MYDLTECWDFLPLLNPKVMIELGMCEETKTGLIDKILLQSYFNIRAP